jgi:hypothetical protein
MAIAIFLWFISHQLAVLFLSEQIQPSATGHPYFSLKTNQHQPSATSQTNGLDAATPNVSPSGLLVR